MLEKTGLSIPSSAITIAPESIYHSIMNRMKREQRSWILHLHCEGSSIRSAERVTGVTKRAVLNLMIQPARRARLTTMST